MHAPRIHLRPRQALRPAIPAQDLRADLDALPAETRRLVRTVGMVLAATALTLACAAAAQTAAYGPRTGGSGALAWLFAVFAGAAVLGVFLLVLSLVRGPRPTSDRLPGTARGR